jgi:hypothetical protein
MPSRNRYRTAGTAAKHASKSAKFAFQSAKSTGKYAEKAIVGLAHWATTDHTGAARFFANMPPMGFIDTIRTLLVTMVISMLSAVLASFLFFLLIAFGIPLLLSL